MNVTKQKAWASGSHMEITFVVTKDCQLACKYCYLVGKNSEERMSWSVAKTAIDYILSSEYNAFFAFESIVFNFIGGEPFLEIDLIEKICDYIVEQLNILDHHWKDGYSFAFTTNGINYDCDKVQNFILKHKEHIYIAITIDGTSRKHDLNRIWKSSNKLQNEKGTYNDVVRNIPLWLSQFPNAATKVTISSTDIPYICESVLHLFSLGIHTVNINCVFENVWKEGDDVLLENQLRLLADQMIDTSIYKEFKCSFFDRRIGHPLDNKEDSNWCGAGRLLAIDGKGIYYPCHRFAKYSLRDKSERVIGNIKKGINEDFIRPFHALRRSIQSTKECFECEVASGCAWCQGENYDCSESGTIFQRSTAICKMHKARVRANSYYWARIDEIEGNKRTVEDVKVDNKCRLDKTIVTPDTVVVLLSSKSTSFCVSDNPNKDEVLLPLATLRQIVEKAKKEDLKLDFVFPERDMADGYMEVINSIEHHNITPVAAKSMGDAVVFNGWNDVLAFDIGNKFCILRTSLVDFYNSIGKLTPLLQNAERLNIVFIDEEKFCKDDKQPYQEALERLSQMVLSEWHKGHEVNLNVITDRLQLTEMDNCNAGWKSVTLAPNGKYYICPDFYYANEKNSCGDIENGLDIKNPLLYKLNHAPICRDCGAYHCQRCVFLNKKKTLEVNIPSYEQCTKAEIELNVSKQFYELWKKQNNI
ncbi:MAG: radical SAM peptide maturase, CXXX-repeat target family [Bacteroidaceae bacterium]|nr:radical SAM peptide maturase, CXXX-repeat target family [Bacteroidaceae bacterium]